MFLRQSANGEWYVNRRVANKQFRNWWLIKYQNKNHGELAIDKICLPEEFVGKRIRLKVEILDGDLK